MMKNTTLNINQKPLIGKTNPNPYNDNNIIDYITGEININDTQMLKQEFIDSICIKKENIKHEYKPKTPYR